MQGEYFIRYHFSSPSLHNMTSMAFAEGLTILFPFVIFFLIVLYKNQRHNSIPKNWPVLGGIPAVVTNVHRAHEYITEVLARTGGTFLLKGPMLTNMNLLLTSDPADVDYIMSKNFPNYPKGEKFHNIFDVFGDGVSNSDGELWQFHRRTLMPLFTHPSFHTLLKKTLWDKVEKGLLPVLDNISRQGVVTDLQDIFQRYSFDNVCQTFIGYDPESLSLDLPYVPCERALPETEEAIWLRHILPENLWKLQQLLRMGNEKKLSDAWKIIDQFIYKRLAENQNDISNVNQLGEENFNFFGSLVREIKDQSVTSRDNETFMRDILFNLMLAGRGGTSSTLSWLFYLLTKNRAAEDKIREEIKTQLHKEADGKHSNDFRAIDLGKLVYLHGGLCETLRLYPAVPFQHKTPVKLDLLPSGHQVDTNSTIIMCFYTMGRMESIWGKDCSDFKPERWLKSDGGIVHQPSYKFPAFNVGPRSCLGKNMSFTQMKIAAASIIYHYHVELVEGQSVIPSNSIIIQMKHGLKVRLTKRSKV